MKKRELRILVVDDRYDDLDTIRDVLVANDFNATCATNGKQAIDILKKKTFDLALIDILMPELSGYDLLKIIRHKYKHKMKLIYISVVPKKEVDMSGADGFVQKPFTPDELIAEVTRALR